MNQKVNNTDFGLKVSEIDKINKVFASYPEINEVILYGSRAKGNYKPGSDIDLSLKGNKLTHQLLNKISNHIDDLLLPYICELSIYHQIDNPALLAHINRVGKVFYKKKT